MHKVSHRSVVISMFGKGIPGLKTTRLLVLHSDDGLRPDADRLIAAIHAAGGTKVQDFHMATDHGWSDKRLTLQALVINWLAGL